MIFGSFQHSFASIQGLRDGAWHASAARLARLGQPDLSGLGQRHLLGGDRRACGLQEQQWEGESGETALEMTRFSSIFLEKWPKTTTFHLFFEAFVAP